MGYFMQYASIGSVILSVLIYIFICFKPSSREQKILHLIASCNVLLCVNDTVALLGKTQEVCEIGLGLSFFGGTFLGLCFFLLLGIMTHIEIPNWIKGVLIVGDCIFIAFGVSNPHHHLMYSELTYLISPNKAAYRIVHYGPVFNLYVVWYLICMVCSLLIYLFCLIKKPLIYKSLKKPLTAFIVSSLFCFMAFILSNAFNLGYDYTFVGCNIGVMILIMIVYRFRAIPMRENTEDEILNSVNDIIVAVDSNERFVYANSFAKNIYDPEESLIYGINIYGVTSEIDKFMGIKPNESVTINNQVYLCEFLPIKTSDGKPLGTIHWLKNVTAERNFIAETIRLKEKAEQASIAKSEFLAHMSHEVRTPINAVLGMNELIQREAKDPTILSYSDDIKRGGQTLLALISDILDFSKVEAGKMDISPATYELTLLLKDLFFATKTRIGNKKIELITNVDENLPRFIYGDVIRVKQVVTNVLTNAAKYTEKGSITFTMKCEELEGDDIQLKITVSDTGIGIKKEDLSKLFDSFERLDTTKNKATEGTGLGMNITKKLLDLMGGCILVDSVYGEGSNFHLIIPQKKVGDEKLGVFSDSLLKCERNTGEKESECFKSPGSVVIVVDDNVVNRRLAIGLLKNSEIEFDEAESGFEFLEKIKEKHYDLILLDHRMPEMSGVEALEKMLSDNTHKCVGVPVIAMTADAGNGASDFFMKAGFNDYISKPMNPSKYEEMVKRFLVKQ